MACCGKSAGQTLQYEVITSQGNKYTVNSIAEAKIKIGTEAGGPHTASHRAVPKKA